MSDLFTTFGIDWKLLLAQMVNFAVLLFVLKRYAYGPILTMLHNRREIIKRGLEDADKAEKSLNEAQRNAEEIRKEAANNANALVTDAQNEASQYVTRAKYDALTEKAKIISSAQGEIDNLKNRNEQIVKEKSVDHIINTVKNILSEEIDQNMNSRIIKRLTQNT